MIYKFNENGTEINIKPERWAWGIIYNDGTELKQFGDDGRFHQIKEIDQDRIKMAILYRLDDPEKRIDIPWRPGMKLIHKYRNIKPHYAEKFSRVYVFGYKASKTVHHYTFVLPDDRMIISPADDVDLTKFNV